MNETIEKLLKQTRPCNKGNRFRGKTDKSRKRAKTKTNSRSTGTAFSSFVDPCALFGLSGLASALGAQQAQATATEMQARAMEAQQQQVSFMREQHTAQSGAFGSGIGQAAAGLF